MKDMLRRVSAIGSYKKNKADTRPPVADGWAGAEMQLSATKNVLKGLFFHFSTRADGPKDRPTNGQSLL